MIGKSKYLIPLVVSFAPASAMAIEFFWTGGGGDYSDATHWTPAGGPPGSSDDAVINDDNLGVAYEVNTDSIEFVNDGTVTVDSASATLQINDFFQFSSASTLELSNGSIRNNGFLNGSGTTAINLGGGQFDITSDAGIQLTDTSSLTLDGATFNNSAGTFRGINAFNSSLVNLNSGQFNNDNGQITLQGNSSLSLNGATITNAITDSVFVFADNSIANFNSGQVNNSGSISVQDGASLRLDGAGFTNQTSGSALAAFGDSAITLSSSQLLNFGQISLLGSSSLTLDGSGRLDNSGLISLQDAGSTLTVDGATLNNASADSVIGAFSGSEVNLASGQVNNSGSLQLFESSLLLGGATLSNMADGVVVVFGSDSAANFSSGTFDNSGLFDAFGGAELNLGAAELVNRDGATFSVSTGATAVIDTNQIVNDGDIRFSAADTQVDILGGTIVNNGDINISGATVNFSGGTIANTASRGLSDNITLFSDSVLNVNGGTIQSDGFNAVPAVDIRESATLNYSAGSISGGTLANAGNLNLAGTGVRNLASELNNTVGTTNVLTDSAIGAANANNSNSGTFFIADGITATFTGDRLDNLEDGLITGSGTLNVNALTFENAGTVAPGFGPSMLTIAGDYTQTDTGILDIEIGGLAVGDEYDQLSVLGEAILDGILDLSLIGGFTPDQTDTFTILTAGSVTGMFGNAATMVGAGSGVFDVIYGADTVTLANFRLNQTAVPVPASLILLCFGLLLIRRKT